MSDTPTPNVSVQVHQQTEQVHQRTEVVNEPTLEPFLFLYITERCQLRCRHCYMGGRLETERRMSPQYVQEVLSCLRILYGQYKVYLLGGEPTTHPDLDAILEICSDQGYKVVLTSNGLIPARAWHALDHRVDSMSFSLDGARQDTHEAMRGPNTYRPLMASIGTAVAAGMQTRAIFTVNTANAGEVLEAIDLAENLGLEMISFHYFTPTGLGRDKPHYQLPPRRWLDLCADIRAAAAGRRVRVFYPPAFADADELARLNGLGYRGCTARNLERLAVFPDGRVYICSMFLDTDLHHGQFIDGRIVPRLTPEGSELTLVNQVSDNCRSCPVSGSCGGGCAAYDRLRTTLASSDCTRDLAPVCPLWSVPAAPEETASRLRELR